MADLQDQKKTRFGKVLGFFGKAFNSSSLVRWSKQVDNIPLNLGDIPSINLYPYSASRAGGDLWQIQKVVDIRVEICPRTAFGAVHVDKKPVGGPLDIRAALDLMASLAPEAMKAGADHFTHPAYVAKLIGHEFPAPASSRPASVPPAATS